MCFEMTFMCCVIITILAQILLIPLLILRSFSLPSPVVEFCCIYGNYEIIFIFFRIAPNLLHRVADIEHLVIVIATVFDANRWDDSAVSIRTHQTCSETWYSERLCRGHFGGNQELQKLYQSSTFYVKFNLLLWFIISQEYLRSIWSTVKTLILGVKIC